MSVLDECIREEDGRVRSVRYGFCVCTRNGK